MYRAPSLALVAEDMTALMIWVTERTAPFLGGSAELLDIKKCPLARLRAFDSDRYDALECTARTISLAW